MGDQQLQKRVYDKLIAHALDYSPAGNSIMVNLGEDGTTAKFSIKNTCVHVDEGDLSRVFEAFFRADQSRNRQTGGSGLGLYIVKKILDLHGTQYSMKNTTGGVIFTILF